VDQLKILFLIFSVLSLAGTACQPAMTPPAPTTPQPVSPSQALSSPSLPASETPTPLATAIATGTPTSEPAGLIRVDSFEQEVYPFVENGKCSLAEAIYAANSGTPQDSCAAGVPGESVIELMAGEYRFTQRDPTPPQEDWVASTVSVGNALPAVIYPLTLRGNGTALIRDEAAEPFRFFEVMFATLTLEDLTLQNGNVGEDWGGAIYSFNATLDLKNVRFMNNRANNGGGIYLTFGALSATDSVFVENQASFGGGGAYLDSSRSTFVNAEFTGNVAESQGGAIRAESTTLVIEDSLFHQNTSTASRGGALYLEHVDVSILRGQFYQNHADYHGGAIYINNPVTNGTMDEEGNPIDQLDDTPMYIELATMIPGYEATLEAHPSGVFQDFREDIQIHDSCFANNTTNFPGDLNWTAAMSAYGTHGQDNYWGDPGGPSGMGPGTGDNIGKGIVFEPFHTARPEFCDLTLSEQE
jgi:predicted outer membrane repeat protein